MVGSVVRFGWAILGRLRIFVRANRVRIIFGIFVVGVLCEGMEFYAGMKYHEFLAETRDTSLTGWVVWKTFMAPCSSVEGCGVLHAWTNYSLTDGYTTRGYRMETKSYLWFKQRRFVHFDNSPIQARDMMPKWVIHH